MVGLLNLIPFLIATVGLYWIYCGWKKKENFVKNVLLRVILIVGIIILYQQFQPSYMPKGEIKRTTTPQFQSKGLEVQDNSLKPMPGEERDLRRKEAYKEKLPFLEKDVDNQN
jgi:hypothetical protein